MITPSNLVVYHIPINSVDGWHFWMHEQPLLHHHQHHHHAVGRHATKTASITWLIALHLSSAVRVMSMSRSLCLSASGFSWWCPWTGDEGALSFCDQKTVESRESALVACLVTSSWVSSPPEILSDQKIFHRWQPCPFEYFIVCYFVHPGYPHDRTQMSHHEGLGSI